ncbi:MAG: nucleotidyltransferase domain-containing protein [bacterium]
MKTLNSLKLKDNEIKAINELKSRILESYPGAGLIIYGSKARGDYDKESDIDVLIVLQDDYKIDRNITFEELEKLYFLPVNYKLKSDIIGKAVDVELKYGVFFDLNIQNKSYLQTNLANIVPLFENLNKEGVTI